MNEFTDPQSLADKGKNAVNKASDSVQGGLYSAKQSATEGLDKLADKADEMKSDAAPAIEKLSDQAQQLMQQGRELVHDTTQRVRENATAVADTAVAYTKDEPMKAMLMAAAAGALLISIISMMARSRR